MANFIILLGNIDKKLLLPLIYIIINFFLQFYWGYYYNNEYNLASYYLQYFGSSIGEIMTFFVCAYLYRGLYLNNKKRAKEKNNNKFKDYIILLLFDAFVDLGALFSTLTESVSEDEETSRDIFINDAIEIIFLSIITYYILKYKYYIHHFISIALIVICGIGIDLLLDNYSNNNIIKIINSFFYILADIFLYSYFKYLIEFKYYYFMDVLFISGIFNFIIHSISFSTVLLYHHLNGNNILFLQFYNYYKEVGVWPMISNFLFGLIFVGFLVGIFDFVILYNLTPNYIIISFEIGKIPVTIAINEGWERWIILIISIFQIFGLLCYLEIFEYNFYSLNKNTKRLISEREKVESIFEKNYSVDQIIIEGYDVSEGFKNQIEMGEKNEEQKEEEVEKD